MQLKKSKNQFPKPHKTTTPKHQDDYVFVEKEGEDLKDIKIGDEITIDYKDFDDNIKTWLT